MTRFSIDCGHTLYGADTGANGCGCYEQNLTREVGMKVISKLRKLGHTVINCTVDNASTLGSSLSQRVNTSNNGNADLFVCIHFNAANGQGHGTEIYTFGGKEFKEARGVLNNLVALGLTNRGIKDGRNLYVIKHTNSAAMLIECCFIDNQGDMSKYNANAFADAIVKGLTGSTIQVADNTVNNNSAPNVSNVSLHLRDWQRAYNETYGRNIGVDGIFGNETDNALSRTLIKKGMRNALVGWLQCRIGANVDYIFGNETYARLIEYQTRNKLSIDGIAGYNTFRKLLEQYK